MNIVRANQHFARILRFSPIIVCLYFLFLTWNYAQVTPIFEASDEAAHFLNIYTLIEDGELPRILSREQIAAQTSPTKLWAIETHQPPLYYALATPLVAVLSDLDDIDDFLRSNDLIFIKGITAGNHNKWLHSPERSQSDTYSAVMGVRMLSMVMGIGTLLCVYASALLVFGDRLKATLAMFFVASIPTFVAISSSVNNDNLVTLLYSLGVYWSLRIWKNGIQRLDIVVIALILSAIAITKLSGLSLFGVIYVALLFGLWRNRLTRAQLVQVVVASLIATSVLAGWWYLRNFDLYGDPLALDATQALWGREYEIAATSGNVLEELVRIGRSFWLMIGHLHLPVYGPDWFYGYAAFIVVLAIIGGTIGVLRQRLTMFQRDGLWLSAAVCMIVAFTLLFGTRSVDISYGRLLFPALVGFSILVVWGISMLFERIFSKNVGIKDVARYVPTVVVLLPLIYMVITTPFNLIGQAYPRLERLENIPEQFTPLDISAESIQLVSYQIQQNVIRPGEVLDFELVFQGQHEQNPALLLTVVDAITLERLGHIEVYPGMVPTDTLNPDQLYQTQVKIPIDELEIDPLSPRRIRVQIAWYSPEEFRDIPLTNAENTPVDVLLVDGPLLLDNRYDPPTPDSSFSAKFGEVIQLQGVDVNSMTLSPGDLLTVETFWQALGQMDENWTLTVQLVDDQNVLLTQLDGEVPGLPTTIWSDDMQTTETRVLTIPEDAPIGEYRLLVAWYRLSDFARLPISEADGAIQDNLLEIDVIRIDE